MEVQLMNAIRVRVNELKSHGKRRLTIGEKGLIAVLKEYDRQVKEVAVGLDGPF